jgi:hypothetical protein
LVGRIACVPVLKVGYSHHDEGEEETDTDDDAWGILDAISEWSEYGLTIAGPYWQRDFSCVCHIGKCIRRLRNNRLAMLSIVASRTRLIYAFYHYCVRYCRSTATISLTAMPSTEYSPRELGHRCDELDWGNR